LTTKDWFAFVFLSLIWGSSYFWIKVAVQELGPYTLVALRLLLAVLGLALIVWLQRPSFPRDRRTWLLLALVGFTHTALPFVLISWSQQHIDTGMAAILNSTVPLFTLAIAHVFLPEERLSMTQVVGLLMGFTGVVVLMSQDVMLVYESLYFLGKGAVLAAALSYAASSVLLRKSLTHISPVVQAFVSVAIADTLVWVAAPLAEPPVFWPALPETWLALAWLGLLGSCIAYLLFFHLIQAIGPTRTTMVTYLMPLIAVALGVFLMHESVNWSMAAGASLIGLGVWVVNQQQ
jgi:drug/metabolite transporter (DMT)-like permease